MLPNRSCCIATLLCSFALVLFLAPTASAQLTFTKLNTFGQGSMQTAYDGAFDSLERLYVTDNNSTKVLVFDRSGTLISQWPVTQFPASIDIDANDVLYVGEQYIGVSVWTSSGVPLGLIGPRGLPPGDGETNGVQDVCLSPDESRLYVADQTPRVQVFDTAGNFLFKWEHGATHGQSILVDPAGDVYVGTSGPDHRVIRYDADGNYILEWAVPGVCFDLASDSLGRILTAIGQQNLVSLYDNTGTFVGSFNSGSLGISIDSAGDIFVATGAAVVEHWRETTPPVSVDPSSWSRVKAEYRQ